MAVSVCRYPQIFPNPLAGCPLWQHVVKHSMLNITILHGWVMALLWLSRQKCEPKLLSGSSCFFCYVFPTLQTISRRSAQRVTDTRTRSLMCRFLSRGSGKMICRARECHGRRRAPLSLCLKYPYTRRTLKRHKHPGTLRLLSILSIPLTQTGRHLKSGKVRIPCLVHSISAKLTLIRITVNGRAIKVSAEYTSYALRPPNIVLTFTHDINNAGQLSDLLFSTGCKRISFFLRELKHQQDVLKWTPFEHAMNTTNPHGPYI